jgi:PAS domain S-box-containing protein
MDDPLDPSAVGTQTRLENELRQAEQRFRAAFDNPALGVAIVGLDGRFLRANGCLCELTGCSEQELLGLTFSEMTHPDDIQVGVDHRARLLRREILSCSFEKRYLRKDGGQVWLLISPTLILDAEGTAVYFITQFQDLTESKRADAARREAEARFRVYVDNAPDGLFVIDREGRYVEANSAACALVGYSREELLRLSIVDLVPPARRQLAATALHALNEGEDLQREAFLQAKNGEVVPVEMHAVMLGGGQLMALCRDMRPRLRAEAERAALNAKLQQAQRLESLGLLAGGVAHDFNNLLVGILGNAELAKRALAPEDPRRSVIDGIRVAATRAAALCSQLLAYTGRGRREIGAVDLGQIARETPEVIPTSTLGKAEIVYDLAPGLALLTGDITQIQQVVTNLLTNACEALAEGRGTVRVSTGRCEISIDDAREMGLPNDAPSGPYVYLEVADDGVGMDEATRSAMFDPFFTTKFTGRGLGLAALQGIVRSHGGCVQVVSDLGKGTSVRVILPAGAALTTAEAKRELRPGTDVARGRLLLIDDDAAVRDATRAMLEGIGYEVVAAANGGEAAGILHESGARVQGVIMDLTMPDVAGEDLFGEVRRAQPGIPIVIASGYSARALPELMLTGPGVVFLQKPYSIDQLSTAVARALDAGPPTPSPTV